MTVLMLPMCGMALQEANETARQMLESLPNKDETEIDDEVRGQNMRGGRMEGWRSGAARLRCSRICVRAPSAISSLLCYQEQAVHSCVCR